jgi:DNA-binding NarL/FixJ family response regulator
VNYSLKNEGFTCVIADDHPMILDAIARQLSRQADLQVTGQANSGSDLLDLVERTRPDVAIVDVSMPGVDGIEVCRRVRAAAWPTRIVLFTGSADVALLERGLLEGAAGFVLKTSDPHVLIDAVRAVADGHDYVDPTLTAAFLQVRRDGLRLSKREQQILQLVAQGRTTRAAAEELRLSPTTVRDYVDSAIRKLSAENRTHAVAEALRLRLIE